MPSLLPGYEYDIFISYRHNDNRSGWVTEFVKALQEELATTIKDPLTVYFDTNPHDGLLETHNVDKTLEGKLKCLIFIPIISQTYCDPKSFAWQGHPRPAIGFCGALTPPIFCGGVCGVDTYPLRDHGTHRETTQHAYGLGAYCQHSQPGRYFNGTCSNCRIK